VHSLPLAFDKRLQLVPDVSLNFQAQWRSCKGCALPGSGEVWVSLVTTPGDFHALFQESEDIARFEALDKIKLMTYH
jgi:hypothetical protein